MSAQPPEELLAHPHRLRDALHFLSRFATQPGSIGSLWPSSRKLAEAMVAGIDFIPGDIVVEYGPGTGPFTSVLRERMPSGVHYLGIERDHELHRGLERRFPGMRFHRGSAEDTPSILEHHGFGRARLILSGLPFANMPEALQERILVATHDSLQERGMFRTFTYLLSAMSPRTRHFRRLVGKHFHHHPGGRAVMRNFPPAKVLIYSKPAKG
jgi:phospholipid N-methyltransferase